MSGAAMSDDEIADALRESRERVNVAADVTEPHPENKARQAYDAALDAHDALVAACARVNAYDDMSCDELDGDWVPRDQRPCSKREADDYVCDSCETLEAAEAERDSLIAAMKEQR